jgi:hypothetical protein
MRQAWQVLKAKALLSPDARDLTAVEVFEIASMINVAVVSVDGDTIRCSGMAHIAAVPLQPIVDEVNGSTLTWRAVDVDEPATWSLTPNEKGGFHIVID